MVYCERLISYMIVCGTIPFTKTTQYDINKKLLIYTRFILVVTFVPLLLSNYSLYNLSVSSPFTHAALTGTYFGYGVSCFVCTLLLHFRFKEISSVLTTIDHYCCSKYIKESHQSNRSPWLCRLLTWNFAFGEFFVILFFIVCVCSSEGYGFSEAVRASIVNHYNLSCDYLFIILSLNGYIVFSGLKTSFQEETEGVRRKYTKREGSILNARDEEIRSKEYRGILFNYYREYSNILGVFEDINECFGAINLVSVTHDLFVTVCVCVIYFVRLGKEDLVVDLDIYYSVFFCQNKVIYRLLIAKLIKEEVENASTVLYSFYAGNDNAGVEEQVEVLSLQFAHRKAEFDACGFFKLDFTLCMSMISTVATYSLIMIQLEDDVKGNDHFNYTISN